MNLQVVDILARGLDMPPLDIPPTPVDTYCALTGQRIQAGYHLWEIVPNSAGEFLDMLPGRTAEDAYLCDAAARCFKNTWNLGNRLIFEDGTHFYPLVDSKAAAAQGRPCWSTLLRDVVSQRADQRYVAILTSDFKKRLWPAARVGTIGSAGACFLYDGERGLSQNIIVDWKSLIICLNEVEGIYGEGFPKPCIENSLYSDAKTCRNIGYPRVAEYETILRHWRATPEFNIVIFVAQKGQI